MITCKLRLNAESQDVIVGIACTHVYQGQVRVYLGHVFGATKHEPTILRCMCGVMRIYGSWTCVKK